MHATPTSGRSRSISPFAAPSLRRPHRIALAAGAVLAACAVAAPVAGAAVEPDLTGMPEERRTPAPDWSGMDASAYAGPIPDRAGVVLDRRPLTSTVSVPGAGSAERILYSTIDQHDRPAVSTAMVFMPSGTPPEGGWPVAAWAHGTTGLGDGCTPSALPIAPRNQAYLGHWLEQGYAVVATDYAGMGTPGLMAYLDGHVEGRNVVDSVLAAREGGYPVAPRWAVIGHSQGAASAMHTAHMATAYWAPQGLDFRGTVATGTPSGIEDVAQWMGPDLPRVALPTGLTAYSLYIAAGLRDARPDLAIDGFLTPHGKELVDRAETTCLDELAWSIRGETLADEFSRPLREIPDVHRVLQDYLGTPVDGYDRPVFMAHGLQDMDVPVPMGAYQAGAMAAHGEAPEFHLYPERRHDVLDRSLVDSTPFLRRVLG